MELNGIANMKMLINHHKAVYHAGPDLKHTFERLEANLDSLERYVLSLNDIIKAAKKSGEIPTWAEVRDTPENFPTFKERMKGAKRGQFIEIQKKA